MPFEHYNLSWFCMGYLSVLTNPNKYLHILVNQMLFEDDVLGICYNPLVILETWFKIYIGLVQISQLHVRGVLALKWQFE